MTKCSQFFRLALVPFGVFLMVVFSMNTNALAAPQAVTWSAPMNRSNTGEKSVYASVAYDAQGKAHIAWLEYNASGESSRLMYTNNIDGSFRSPYQVVDSAGKNVEHITAISVETTRVHLFYTSSGKSLRHVVVNLSGSSPSNGAITTLSGGRGYAPATTVDTSGRVHVAFIDNSSGRYQVYHRVWTNGSWSGSTLVRSTGGTQDSPSIVATNDGRVHLLFSVDSNPLSYAIYNGSWSNASGPSDEYGNISGLATNGTSVFAVWSNKSHRIRYAENAGSGWQNQQQISEGSTWSDYPAVTYSPGNQKVYAVWGALTSPNTKIVVREIIPGGQLNDVVTIGSTVPSIWPRAAASSNEISMVWQDKSPGGEEIRHVTAVARVVPTATPVPPTATPTPVPPSGSLQLTDPSTQPGQNGELYTNQAVVNAQIRQTGGAQANEYGLSDGGDPGDPGQGFNGSDQTVQFNLNVTNNGQCSTRTVNGRLQGSGGIGNIFSDAITYDPSVSADITAYNPNLGSPPAPSLTGGNNARTAASPRNFGDPSYTNMNVFSLALRNGANECSGLSTYSLNFTDVPSGANTGATPSQAVPSTGITSANLPGTVQGTYTFRASVSDNAGNSNSFGSYSITYDNEAPTVTPPRSGIPAPRESADGVVTVDLSGVTVQDNLYRTSGRQYYGYWIIVTKAGREPSDLEWQVKGVPVAGNASTLKWNLALGLVDTFEPGEQYQLNIRFVDGAGNVSDQTLTTPGVTVNELEGPRLFLPLVMR